MPKHDLFISHASEDKDDFVRPLANALERLELDVWYDEFSVTFGDSVSASIDAGLKDSRYGVLVLSRNFLSKRWPEYEYRSLIALEDGKQKRIIPIWHNVTRDELLAYSPYLADKVAILSAGKEPLSVALEVMRIAVPEKFTELVRRHAAQQASKDLPSMELRKISKWPFMWGPLKQSELRRLRLVREILAEVFPQTWEDLVSDFRRDMPSAREGEIQIWERLAGIYAVISRKYSLTKGQKQSLFAELMRESLAIPVSPDSKNPEWILRAVEDYRESLPDGGE
ncbi:toll/interleukin-1 receptor domain-containing protein [Actinomadura sp. 7K507]|uniref:toll/interleukin-1 receptor domain-containing protein n=1 Tax=Actinomadura sp. 7K507 TaxID=2530365 RepID=UPI0014056046|nr:toll/interleukin-1 receptor domain-containing protein [Actinomadura sp. 7K507]